MEIDKAVQMIFWTPRRIDRAAYLRTFEKHYGKEFAKEVETKVREYYENRNASITR